MLAERLAEETLRFASAWNFGPANADARMAHWIADELVRLWGRMPHRVAITVCIREKPTFSS